MAEVAIIDIDGIQWEIRDDVLTERFEQFLQQRETQRRYSTSEVNTGKKWIDGKPIYRIVVDCDNSTGSVTGQWYNTRASVPNIKKLISGVGLREDNVVINNMDFRYDSNTYIYYYRYGVSANPVTKLILEYTKTTD